MSVCLCVWLDGRERGAAAALVVVLAIVTHIQKRGRLEGGGKNR